MGRPSRHPPLATVALSVLVASSLLPAEAAAAEKKAAPDPRGGPRPALPGAPAAKKAEKAADREKPAARPKDAWWNRSYAARRAISFEKEPAKGDAALLVLGTAGLTRPDARDIRVVADHQAALPFEIIEIGPGDLATIAFEVPEPGHDLHAYFGCPHADAPRHPARELRGGLRLEVRALPAGGADGWPDMQKLLKAGGDPIGVLFPDVAALGVAPLGRPADWIARYVGWLRVDRARAEKGRAGKGAGDKPAEKAGAEKVGTEKAGTGKTAGEEDHIFETASDGASFVIVDEKLVAAWPGFHDLSGYAELKGRKEHSGAARLAPGFHKVEYIVATKRGGPHVLGLRAPGEPFARPIPPDRWARWARARPGPLELPGEAAADFTWRISSDTGSDAERHDLALLEFEWSGDLAGRVLRDVAWDFGDGQKATGVRARHVYLARGVFDVTATGRAGPGKILEARRRVAARFESVRVHDLNRILDEYHDLARGYDLAALPEAHLASLIWLAKKDFAWEDTLGRALDAWFDRGLSLARDGLARDGIRRARRMVQERESLDRAESILARVARDAPKPDDRRDGAAWLARSWSLRGDAKRAAEAEESLRKLRAEAGSTDPGRRAGIFLADLLLANGKAEEAEKLLAEMEEGPFRRFEGERQIAAGAHAVAFDNLLRRGELRDARDELERWEWALPLDGLAGHIQMRRAALLRKEKKLDAALLELDQVLALRAAANQVPRALLLAAEILVEKGDRAGARARLERVVRDHPQRPERKEAEEKLAALR